MTDGPDTCDLLCLDLPKAERVRAALPPLDALEPAAGAARALGDPTRLAVAAALGAAGTACICDLAWIVGRSERLVSHHARQLKAAGVARSRREGKMAMYELTEHGERLLAAVLGEAVGAGARRAAAVGTDASHAEAASAPSRRRTEARHHG